MKADNMEYEKKTASTLLQQLGQIEQVLGATGKPAVSEQGAIGGDSGTKKSIDSVK